MAFVKNETEIIQNMSKYEMQMMFVSPHVKSSVSNSSVEIINIAIERILDKCRLGGSFINLTSTLLNSIFQKKFFCFRSANWILYLNVMCQFVRFLFMKSLGFLLLYVSGVIKR